MKPITKINKVKPKKPPRDHEKKESIVHMHNMTLDNNELGHVGKNFTIPRPNIQMPIYGNTIAYSTWNSGNPEGKINNGVSLNSEEMYNGMERFNTISHHNNVTSQDQQYLHHTLPHVTPSYQKQQQQQQQQQQESYAYDEQDFGQEQQYNQDPEQPTHAQSGHSTFNHPHQYSVTLQHPRHYENQDNNLHAQTRPEFHSAHNLHIEDNSVDEENIIDAEALQHQQDVHRNNNQNSMQNHMQNLQQVLLQRMQFQAPE